MSLFDKKFRITGWRGKWSLTAKQIYERVMEDSKSDYNWIASATELVRVCNESDFSEEYAKGIKIAILNCFANWETKKEYPGYTLPTDKAAVYSCYHSLDGTETEVVAVKSKYLMAVIEAITLYDKTQVRFPFHIGPAYTKICKEWKKSKFDDSFSKSDIDFEKLREELYEDFEKTIRKAEEEGTFKEDDEREAEALDKFLSNWYSVED